MRVLESRIPSLVLLCAAVAVFVSQCVFVGDANVDDAFFTFSFARNLGLGNGPVYSHGVRVEGYSTFLWMVLLAPGLAFRGQAPVEVARVIGAPLIALLGYAMYQLTRALGAGPTLAAASVLLLSFNTDLVTAYLTGMETAPYVALMTLAFALMARSFSEPALGRVVPYAALAVALMRIDGFVPAGFLLGCSCVRDARQDGPSALLRTARQWAPALALYALWFVWRWQYYGLPLPSTYYAKSTIALHAPRRGLEYAYDEIVQGFVWVGLVAWPWLLWRRNLAAAWLGGFLSVGAAYAVRVGGDWMPFGRFVLPIVPLSLSIAVSAAGDMVKLALGWKTRLRWLVPLLPGALALATAARMDHRVLNGDLEDAKLAQIAAQKANVAAYEEGATMLRQVVPPGGRLVTDYGGVLGYHTDGAVIEMWGLANAMIATRGTVERVNPIYGKTCPACYPALDPEFFHVAMPFVRKEPAFGSPREVVNAVWQADTIGRHLDLRKGFAVGRVVRPARGDALYFLQKRAPHLSLSPRETKAGYVVEYPFERRGAR